MRTGTCATCAFWHDVNDECRVNPPVPIPIIGKTDAGLYRQGASSVWPTVDSDDWCGQYVDGRDAHGVRHTADRRAAK